MNADEQHYYDTLSGQWKRIKVGNNFDPQVDAVTGAGRQRPASVTSGKQDGGGGRREGWRRGGWD